MSRMVGCLVALSLVGCGKGQLFGPGPGPAVKVILTNTMGVAMPEAVFINFVQWRDEHTTELKGKTIFIELQFRMNRIMATTEKDQGKIILYMKTTDTIRATLVILAGEIDRIRGRDQAYLDRQDYHAMIQEFGY